MDASMSFDDREGRGTRSLSRDQVGKKERWMSRASLSRGGKYGGRERERVRVRDRTSNFFSSELEKYVCDSVLVGEFLFPWKIHFNLVRKFICGLTHQIHSLL
jgi:hypothetical protein